MVCSTPFGIIEGNTEARYPDVAHEGHVLNAFRHHGRNHDGSGEWVYACSMCSTPFGIIEGNTQHVTEESYGFRHVLNAFRHH